MLEKKIEELPNRGEKKDKFSIYKRKKKQRKNTKAYKLAVHYYVNYMCFTIGLLNPLLTLTS